jgi:hypothetical protein
MKKETVRPYIIATFALAFVLRAGYAIVAPPFESPDEYSHYHYVKYVHEMRELPVQADPAVRAEELQYHQAPLYYILASHLFPSTTWIAHRPALPLRFMNIAIAMLTILMAYRFASIVLPNNPFLVALICSVVAFTPTFAYTSSTIRNGVLASFFASWGFLLCARKTTGNSLNDRRWLWVGLVGGLAILSMLTAVAFVAAAGVLLLATSPHWKNALRRAVWFSTGVLCVSGWWFVRNKLLYGSFLKVVETGFQSTHADQELFSHLKYMMITLFKTFWAVFGRINEIHFQDIYRFCWWFVGLALLGFIRYLIQRNHELPRHLLWLSFSAIAVSLSMTLHYAYNYDSDQGRYMFPVLIPITTIMALGLNALFPRQYHRWVLSAVILSFVGINTLVLWRMMAFYN